LTVFVDGGRVFFTRQGEAEMRTAGAAKSVLGLEPPRFGFVNA
jgi:hypothetical protein